ncbi:hypothetical protein [Hymenobacter crusticola]|uniref:STAS/SEC14 domain-containing protein n=1 Tax=Hymenobacter crusticola TaxID=1770526 RepID=A0A243WF82_9BACT|nr:hypothetical protein [Hymenobacter crusticola]OUJ74312.1 hypothetical protein BXP70_11385 [Hymenobacter crusticola]
MLHHTLTFSSSQDTCTNEYDEVNHWLRATWKGFINSQDATRGATQTLEVLRITHAPYLLNDNSQLVGPWFDSIEWLQQEWVPQATTLGLRYVAHVMPADANADITTVAMRHPEQVPFELQIFRQVEEAQEWLRSCQEKK